MGSSDVSKYSASLGDKIINAAYLTLEGMVIYNCASYPAAPNGTTFTDNVLVDKAGKTIRCGTDRLNRKNTLIDGLVHVCSYTSVVILL